MGQLQFLLVNSTSRLTCGKQKPDIAFYKWDFFLCSRKRRSTDDLQDVFDDDDLAESDFKDDDHSDDLTTPRELNREEDEVLARSSETLKTLNFNFDASDIAKVKLHPNGKIKSIEFKSAASAPLKKEKVHLGDVVGKSYWQSLETEIRRRLITSIRSLTCPILGCSSQLLWA